MTIEEILRAQGYTDADIASAAPLLQDARFRSAVEQNVGELERQNTAFKKENEAWANWHESEGKPILAMYEKDAADAKAEAAAMRERLRLAEQQGYAPAGSVSKEPEAKPTSLGTTGQSQPFDAKAHKVVTYDDIAFLADKEGDAIALSHDIAGDYAALTGKSLMEHTYTSRDGRQLHGMRALRQQAKDEQFKGDLYGYVEQKFDFAGKRAAAAEKSRQAAEEAIRADERTKMATKYGNPELRTLRPSAEPFLPPLEKDAKQPWETDPQERKRTRLEKLVASQMNSVQ